MTAFLEAAEPWHKWLKFCKEGIDQIRAIYRNDKKKVRERTGQELTLANYFKSQTYTAKILAKPIPPQMKKLARQLSRTNITIGNRKHKPYKNPKRVEGSIKAWETIRAKNGRSKNAAAGAA